MLAYYVEWHKRKALAPMLFDDEMLNEDRKTRHPVRPAEDSLYALLRITRRKRAAFESVLSKTIGLSP